MVLDDSENVFKDPNLPEERLRFFLPLKSQEGVFGTMEVVSAVPLLDEENKIKVISYLEILSNEVVSSCNRFIDKSTIGFGRDPQVRSACFQVYAQHSVHPTGGSRRVFKQVAWLQVGSGKVALSRPAHPRVTHAVRQPPAKKVSQRHLQ